ncbi:MULTISPECIES: AAA-like domain-containing protein [unclassified Microcoleus]|uniref:AAA-like domain-containing protein n=1 Tax=unclassified Microcoleus TaxID=2642155 RepID=UPI0025FFE23A|nr:MULTISPECIES: AAA-like domain-containing protein [unclassified Microcoleus]
MTEHEFEAIYKNITPTQHSVLEMFLEGRLDPEISQVLYKDRTAVSSNISKICKLFGVENKPGAYTQRDDLIELFINHKPQLVGEKLLIKFGKKLPETPKVLQVPYVERHPIESECCDKILEPGAVIRIKAPKYTGKTLLLNRILDRAKIHNYQAVILDFTKATSSVLLNYEELLKWLCKSMGKSLGLENKLAEHWDSDEFDEHTNTQTYFEDYLLKDRTQPLVLALKNVDRVFEQESFRIDFCELLRCWSQLHVEGNEFAYLWKNLRLILVHSTNVYGSLDINYSPLNGVGLTQTLLDFTPKQVSYLASCYQIQRFDLDNTEKIMTMFGGHPYLIQEAFVCLKKEQYSLDQLLEIAATEASPFINHLREQWGELCKNPQLKAAYSQVVATTQPVRLDTNATFKLQGMGLVLVDKNDCLPRCDLYRQYFSDQLNFN